MKKCPRKAFTHLSEAQLWPAQWGARILVRHEALNRRAHAVSSQPALMALPERTKAEDRSQPLSILIRWCGFYLSPVLLLLQLLHVQNELEIPPPRPPTQLSAIFPSHLPDPPAFFSLLPLGPSQVEMMYDSCCQHALPREQKADNDWVYPALPASHPLCQSPRGRSPRVTSVFERAGAPHSAAVSAREREREKREPVTGGGTIVSA